MPSAARTERVAILPPPRQSPERRNAPPELSIVIPVYNGAPVIGRLVDAILRDDPGITPQIVLVNDASPDGSAAICRQLACRHPGRITFVDLAKNEGEHNAVMAGLAHARGEFVVVMDDDFQNPPSEAYRLHAHAVDGNHDIVYSRYERKRHHPFRNVGSMMANAMARRLMHLPEGLYLSSFKCMSRFVVDHVLLYDGPFPYVDGLALRASRNIGVVTVAHEPSAKSASGYTVSKLFRLWGSMAVNFSILPLRLASGLGLTVSFVGFLAAIAVVVEKFQNPALPVGWPSTAVAILIFSGVQLLIIGILGEYLGQILMTINKTPQFVVRDVVECPPD